MLFWMFLQPASSQNKKNEKVDFDFIQAPYIKIDRNWKYNVQVIQKNKQEIKEKREAFSEKQEKLDNDFEKELEGWTSAKAVGKIVTKKPERKTLEPYFIGTLFDEKSLATEYGDLEGFERTHSDTDFSLIITLDGFSYVSGEKKREEDYKKQYYLISFRNPFTLSAIDKQGNQIWAESYNGKLLRKKILERGLTDNSIAKSWKEGKVEFINSIEDESTSANLELATKELNNNLGFPRVTRQLLFYNLKGKKFDYAELNTSIENLNRALAIFEDDPITAKGIINSSIGTWEKELQSKDLDSKKARINKTIAAALYMNLAHAYTILGQFEEAAGAHLEAKLLKINKFDFELKALKEFIDEFKKRYT